MSTPQDDKRACPRCKSHRAASEPNPPITAQLLPDGKAFEFSAAVPHLRSSRGIKSLPARSCAPVPELN
jgi:hypothetical protein